MSSNVITYNVNYINKFRHQVRKGLPNKVARLLNIKTKIRVKMNDKDLKIFNRVIDNFNEEELQKKIKSLLNKLTRVNIDGIFQQVNEILKNRKVLIEYTIKNIMASAIQMPLLCDTYANFYKKLYSKKTEAIFQETLKELLDIFNGKVEVEVNSAIDYKKFLKYLQDKEKFTGLHLFLASLYKLRIIKRIQIEEQLKYLEDTIKTSDKLANEKYCETYTKFLTKLNKKEIFKKHLETIQELKNNTDILKPRMKFALMNILDLYEKM